MTTTESKVHPECHHYIKGQKKKKKKKKRFLPMIPSLCHYTLLMLIHTYVSIPSSSKTQLEMYYSLDIKSKMLSCPALQGAALFIPVYRRKKWFTKNVSCQNSPIFPTKVKIIIISNNTWLFYGVLPYNTAAITWLGLQSHLLMHVQYHV